VKVVVDPHSVELRVGRPLDQFDHDIDTFSLSYRRDAEEVLDVQNTETAHLDVVSQEVRRLSENHTRRPVVALDDVVGDEAVPAQDEVERAFAFSDRARPGEKQPHPEHVDEHAVERGSRRESIVEKRVDRADGAARTLARNHERGARVVRPTHELGGRCRSARDDDARELESEEAARGARLPVGVERIEIGQLRFAEDLDAARNDAVVVPGEREPRLLDARVRDTPAEPGAAADESQIDGKTPVLEQLPRRHGRASRQFRVLHAFSS
jgi:hypothetical protein